MPDLGYERVIRLISQHTTCQTTAASGLELTSLELKILKIFVNEGENTIKAAEYLNCVFVHYDDKFYHILEGQLMKILK